MTDVTLWFTAGWFSRCVACRRLLLVPGVTSGRDDDHPSTRRPVCSDCARARR